MIELRYNHPPNQFYKLVTEDGKMRLEPNVDATMFEYNTIEMEVPKPDNSEQMARFIQTTSELRDLQRLRERRKNHGECNLCHRIRHTTQMQYRKPNQWMSLTGTKTWLLPKLD